MDNQLLTAEQVAEILQVKVKTVYRYARENKLDSIKLTKTTIRFTKDAVEKFLKEGSSL